MRTIVALALLTISSTAHAQMFPPDSAFRELLCGGLPMFDAVGDEAGALADRDIVGDFGDPAGMRAADQTHLYLRMRLDQDPAPGGVFRQGSWGFEIDVDGMRANYELLVIVDATGPGPQLVRLMRNTTTAQANDPTDPAEMEVMTFPTASHARAVATTTSSLGGNGDFFLDVAVPWSALMPLGLDRDQRIFMWVASSTLANALNGDFACHAGASGEPTLDGVASDPTAGDPDIDSDNDGFSDAEEIEAGSNPNDPNSVPASRLEGGGGCSAGGGGIGIAFALLAIRWRRAGRRRAAGPR